MNKNLLKALGPGILFASTAIGVSHLVQSTRAGAQYGFALVGLVLLANLMKYPFFEYASRYANAKGESIIDGYKRIGNWALLLYFLITLSSMFFVTAAVGFVTAGFMDNLFGISKIIEFRLFTPILLFVICIAILTIGNYKALDSLIKVIGSVLLVSTLVAFIIAVINGPAERLPDFVQPDIWDEAGIAFIIALMGWMPTALDLSSWNSLWTIERIKQTNYHPKLKETLADFNFGYWVAVVLAVCFITLGALMMYGTGVAMPKASHLFANQVVQLYTQNIGQWSYFIIAAAAFSIMFGTSIAVFDGYARTLERCVELFNAIKDKEDTEEEGVIDNSEVNQDFKVRELKNAYAFALIFVALGAFIIIWQFVSNLRALVDLATTISFLISPFIAIANFHLVSEKYIAKEAVPPLWLKVLSYLGIIFLFAFSFLFLYTKFF